MILITSSDEFSFISLFSIIQSVFISLISLFNFFLEANSNPLGRIVSLLSGVYPVLVAGVHVSVD